MIVTDGAADKYRPFKAGKFDHRLLCSTCDGVLGRHEANAFSALNRLNMVTAGLQRWQSYESAEFDRTVFLRFLAGLIWKYASTQRSLGQIDIGPYRKRLEDIAFGAASIPSWLDAILFRLGTHDTGSTFYREPKPDRKLGVNIVRLSLCHFVIFVKLDKRSSESVPLAEWLNASERRTVVAVVPFDTFEEGAISLSSREKNHRIKSFFERSASRRAL